MRSGRFGGTLKGLVGALAAIFGVAGAAHAGTLYVANAGRDAANGAKGDPLATICAALDRSHDGDTIAIAEGSYRGGCESTRRAITLQGGYKSDFSARDPFVDLTRVEQLDVSRPIFKWGKANDDVVIDGVVLEGAARAYSGSLSCRDCLEGSYNAERHAPLVEIAQAGRVTLRNAVLANAPGGGVRGAPRGSLTLDNVGLVNMRPFAVQVSGACGYAAPVCVDLTVKNTIAIWTVRAGPVVSAEGGSAFDIGVGVRVRIERSIIAHSDRVGLELSELPEEASLTRTVFFNNGRGDVGVRAAPAPLAALAAQPIDKAAEVLRVAVSECRGEGINLPWDAEYYRRSLSRSPAQFYAARVPINRAIMLSPQSDIGLQPPRGSRLTYGAAASGALPGKGSEAKRDAADTKKEDADPPGGDKKRHVPSKRNKRGKTR